MIIGLTGSIASGKSTVTNLLKDRGYPIVDADEIARLVVKPGSPVLEDIKNAFGAQAVFEDGTMNRDYIGNIVFSDSEKRTQLNEMIHPAIRKELISQKEAHLAAGAKTVILDIPLLFENGLQEYVERIIVVSVTKDIQKQRLIDRNGFSDKAASERIASQLPMEVKEQGADAVIMNNGTVEETAKQLDELLVKWNA